MSTVIEARARIVGEDATGKAFDAVAKKISNVAKAAQTLNGIKPMKAGHWGESFTAEIDRMKVSARELATIQRSFESFNKALMSGGAIKASRHAGAIDLWKDRTLASLREVRSGFDETERVHRRFFARAGRFGLQVAGIGAAGYAANRGIRSVAHAGMDANRQETKDWQAGLTPTESKRIGEVASTMSAKYPSLTGTSLHEQLRDFQMSVGDMKKMEQLSEVIAQGSVVLQAMKGKDKAIEESRKFFKALDVLGKNVDPSDVKELYTGFVKAMGVEGADMNMGDVLQLAKKSRAAGSALSNRFLFTSGSALMQDLGAQETGTALASGLSQNIAGRATKASKAAQQAYGLRDKEGNFVNRAQYLSDPDLWAWNTLKPALQKKGVDTNNDVAVAEVISKLFSNRTVSDIFNKLITQEPQYRRKGEEQYPKAKGPESAKELAGRDFGVALEGFKAQMVNFAAQTTPLFDAIAPRLSSFAESLGKLNDNIKSGNFDKGDAALAGGLALGGAGAIGASLWGGKKLLDLVGAGPALVGSAAALDASAAALTAAAAKIAMGAPVGAVASALPAATTAAASGGVWAAGAAAAPWILAGAAVVGGGIDYRNSKQDAGTWDMPGGEAAQKMRGGRSIAQSRRDAFNAERRDMGLPLLGAPAAPVVSPTMTYGTGAGGDRKIDVKGEVSGEVKGKFTVEAGSALLRMVEDMKELSISVKGQLRGLNGPGSTGRSSPDASPATGLAGPR